MAKRVRTSNGSEWQAELLRWLAPFLAALPRSTQRRWAPVYVEGMLGASPRKSVEPMAATVAVGDYNQLHHFLSTTAWDAAPVLRVLAATAQEMIGGPAAVLIVDDTTLLKKGTLSVGVGQPLYLRTLDKWGSSRIARRSSRSPSRAAPPRDAAFSTSSCV